MAFQKGHPPYNRKRATMAVDAPQTPDVSAEVAALRAELAELKTAQAKPQFVKMRQSVTPRQRTYVPPERLRAQAMKTLAKGESSGAATRWWDTPEGRSKLPPEYRPVFGPGDLVRVNPDAPVFGGPVALKDAKNTIIGSADTWGELLNHLNLEGVGEVVGTMLITDTFEPKYKVNVAGLTTGFGGGFRESELLPYE